MNMLLVPFLLASTVLPHAVTIIEPRDHILSSDKAWHSYPGGWTPDRADVLRAKTAMMDWLGSPERLSKSYDPFAGKAYDPYAKKIDTVRDRIGRYGLQYLGVRYARGADGWHYDASGSRGILIHGISADYPSTAKPDALDSEMVMFDGGTNFFDTLIDAEDGTVVWFSVHGVA